MNALIHHHVVSLCASIPLGPICVYAQLVTAKIILKTKNYIVLISMSAMRKLVV